MERSGDGERGDDRVNWGISAWVLLIGTVGLYFTGAISGYTSKTLLIIFGALLLIQILVAVLKRAWQVVGLALTGVGLLFLWELSGKIHAGIKQVVQNDAFLSKMGSVATGASFFLSLFPLLILAGVILLIMKKGKVEIKDLLKFDFIKGEPSNDQYPSLRICKNAETGKEVVLNGLDRCLHMMVVGPTGGGKTALSLEPYVNQDIEFIASGGKTRVIVIEPDGEFSENLAEYSESLNVPTVRIDATDPNPEFHWNAFEGPIVQVSETVTAVLKNSGSKDEFFSNVQETASRYITQLLKLIHGDDMDIMDFADALRSVETVREKLKTLQKNRRQLTEQERFIADDVIDSLSIELKDKESAAHFQKVCMGLRMKINNLIGNPNIRKILSGKSTFSFDDYFDIPGVLSINTGNTEAGDMFGKFLLLSLQDATLRRPGKANTRSFVATYIDEFARYATERYSTAFTQGRKYRNAQTIAFQSFSQLELPNNKGYKTVVKGSARNKIVLSGLEDEDAAEASRMMGTEETTDTSVTYAEGLLSKENQRTSERTKEKSRFSPSDLMFMPWNQVVYKIVINKQQMIPELGVVDYAKRKTLSETQRSSKLKEITQKKKHSQSFLRAKDTLFQLGKSIRQRSVRRSQVKEIEDERQSYLELESDIDMYLRSTDLPSDAFYHDGGTSTTWNGHANENKSLENEIRHQSQQLSFEEQIK